MNVISKTDSKLLNRTEYVVKIGHAEKSTPSTKEVKDLICKNEACDSKLVVVKSIKGSFGGGESDALVYVYKNKEDLEKLEGKTKEEKKEEEAPIKEEPKEEKKDGEEAKVEKQGSE